MKTLDAYMVRHEVGVPVVLDVNRDGYFFSTGRAWFFFLVFYIDGGDSRPCVEEISLN